MSRLLRFGHEAMATHFEIFVPEGSVSTEYAEQAATAAFNDIDQLESELSKYKDDSDISSLRSLEEGQSTVVSLATFDCLSLAKQVSDETGGAFDVAIAPIYTLWKSCAEQLRTPTEAELEDARSRSGSALFELDESRLEVRVLIDGLSVDLGGIGKGYALDQAGTVLEEWGIASALLNSGDSTVLALDPPPGADAWEIGATGETPVRMSRRALSASGFSVKGSHIIDPRNGTPVPILKGQERVWSSAPTAALADALSTAFIVMSEEEIEGFCSRYPGEIEVIHPAPPIE